MENEMYNLIGVRTEYVPNIYTGGSDVNVEETVVATFDTEQMAHEYVVRSKLQHPRSRRHPFKQKSLLNGFEYAEIQKACAAPPPHNPRI